MEQGKIECDNRQWNEVNIIKFLKAFHAVWAKKFFALKSFLPFVFSSRKFHDNKWLFDKWITKIIFSKCIYFRVWQSGWMWCSISNLILFKTWLYGCHIPPNLLPYIPTLHFRYYLNKLLKMNHKVDVLSDCPMGLKLVQFRFSSIMFIYISVMQFMIHLRRT